jgi:hypothetical protein
VTLFWVQGQVWFAFVVLLVFKWTKCLCFGLISVQTALFQLQSQHQEQQHLLAGYVNWSSNFNIIWWCLQPVSLPLPSAYLQFLCCVEEFLLENSPFVIGFCLLWLKKDLSCCRWVKKLEKGTVLSKAQRLLVINFVCQNNVYLWPVLLIKCLTTQVRLFCILQVADSMSMKRSAASMLSGKKPVQALVSFFRCIFDV